ncbi:MAG: hypothetical protein KID00_14185 [Clostridium argentinense]|uniref:hypothetical protein n=1 Tax=uncultured Clostridium sp. TaxID=59620 RepID=UPI001D7DDD8E|nr:hypothetical protein [uncultured Clostridium sp.]MBS5824974.1 hypothetical protein [Clostridium argentinense]MDU1349435.1 hypothetical protein [Clostridium argentinense]
MKKRIGILVLMGLVAVNTLYTTAFAKELKTINKDYSNNKSITVCSEVDPKPW